MTGILNSLLKVSQKNVPSITRVHLRCYKKGLAATIGPTININGEGRGKRKATAKQCAAANLIKTITARQRKGNLAQELKPLSTDQLELAIMLMSEYLPFDEDLEIVSHDEYRKSPIYTPLINTAGNYIRCKALGLNAVGNGKTKDIARRMSAKLILDKYQEIKKQKKKDQKLKNCILTESIDK